LSLNKLTGVEPPMPPPSSQVVSFRPSALLALVCAAIVRAFDPSWLARPVAELAKEAGIRPERVSRLWRRLLAPLEKLLERASTRGRKKKRRPSKGELRRIRTEALLDVSRELIRLGGVGKRRAQDFLVAARDRLKRERDISHEEFCQALGLSERTVRSWARRGVAALGEPEPVPPPEEKRLRGVGRFDLSVTLPDLQVVGDTTNVEILRVPLKVVAFQDPGRRHLTPWESFVVESEENHEIVLEALKDAVGDRAGMQVVVDQGTPYMAEALKQACEELELLHEPQKEAAPTEKATKERQFGVVKHFLGPIFGLTKKLAEFVPSLQNVELAKALGRLLLGTYLRVYVSASAVRETNRPDDPAVLEEVARAQRERAVATNRSKKLKLEAIFERYGFEGSKRNFVRVHRERAFEDIDEAERRLAVQAAGTKIGNWAAYFSGILKNVGEERAVAREREAWRRRRDAEERARRREEERSAAAWRQALAEDPERRLAEGLGQIAAQYLPPRDRLFNDGVGLGTREVRQALRIFVEESGGAAVDRAELGWRIFEKAAESPAAVPHVRRVFEALLATARKEIPSNEDPTSAILDAGSDKKQNPRPPPGPDLRFRPAGSDPT
jgi:hypothetical protein